MLQSVKRQFLLEKENRFEASKVRFVAVDHFQKGMSEIAISEQLYQHSNSNFNGSFFRFLYQPIHRENYIGEDKLISKPMDFNLSRSEAEK